MDNESTLNETTKLSPDSFIKLYNGRKLETAAALYLNGFAPGYTLSLSQSNIMSIKIVRDLHSIFPRVHMMLKDINNQILALLRNNGIDYITLTIRDNSKMIDEGVSEADATFKIEKGIINKFTIVSTSLESTTIEIEIIEDVALKFYKAATYSTGSSAFPVTDIIKSLLISNGYSSSDFNEGYLTKSTNKMIYITDNNEQMLDKVHFLLNNILDDNGFAFLYWHPIDRKFRFIFSNIELNRSVDNPITIMMQSANNAVRAQIVSSSTEMLNNVSLYESLEYYKHSIALSFDLAKNKYVDRSNEENDKTDNNNWTLNKIFKAYSPDNKDKCIYANESVVSNKTKYVFDAERHDICQDLRNQFLNSELLSVMTIGEFDRNPGVAVNIENEQPITGNRFSGKWFCRKIVDIIENNTYNQYMYLCRSAANYTPNEINTFIQEYNTEYVNTVERPE